jgi:hypothetical protein
MGKQCCTSSKAVCNPEVRVHRRTLPTRFTQSFVPNQLFYSAAIDLGFDTLPRTCGKVWAAEILKINYLFADFENYTSWTDDMIIHYGCVSDVSTAALSQLGTNNPKGADEWWSMPFVIDSNVYRTYEVGTSGFAVTTTNQVTADMTDTLGQGVLVFSDKLYMVAKNTGSGTEGNLGMNMEVFFRYRQVDLESYLSTKQDMVASAGAA